MEIKNIDTFDTDYGKISIYKNEAFIINDFKKGSYWDINTLRNIKQYIDHNKNILEIGGHCGTSSIVYASYINDNNKIYVYEPQKKLFELLLYNVKQNNLEDKIKCFNEALFCDNIEMNMNMIDLDGGKGIIMRRYTEQTNLKCNFGGACLGKGGETVNAITLDSLNLENIGFIHCDAQGAENHIFSSGLNFIKKHKPVILYENNKQYAKYLYDKVTESYPKYVDNSLFDVKKYCINDLKYSNIIPKFNDADDLLIP